MKLIIAVLAAACGASAAVGTQRLESPSVEALILAEDRRASRPGDYELLASAAGSAAHPLVRARAVRALGRLEQSLAPARQPADLIERALGDPDPHVRRTAAYALAQSVNVLDAVTKAPRRAAILTQLALEQEDAVTAALLESAARLADAASIAEVERAALSQPAVGERPDAVASTFEILARRGGKPGVLSAAALEWLRAAVFAPSLSLPARRAALQALGTSGAVDAAFAARAFATEDWQVRRIAIASVQGGGELSNLVDRAMRDPDPHVRVEALRVYIRRLKAANGCVPIVSAMKDPDPHVALAAIDGLAGCIDPAVAQSLTTLALSPGGVNWHRASHALVALARLDPARARELLAVHAADAAWPVRVYAAAAAGGAGDDARLEALAADAHPNVREAAIAGLVARAASASPADRDAQRARLSRAVALALADRQHPQLIRTAARAVAATGNPSTFKQALLDALDAIDAAGGDTTIDARVAIIGALKAAAPADTPPSPPRPRDPMTPSVQELRTLPSRARIEMARGGVIELELLADEAPATVARFARLARAGYYDGLTFHRVEPNFVVQGGSPWANEYAGTPRFQRDELGFARHERGAVGISTRGRDTGDAQIFIDLVDLPRLNHNYTVFARVISGMDVVDRILEADVIQRIAIVK